MGTKQCCAVVVVAVSCLLLRAGIARAITLPDSGTCNSTSSNGCFRVTNTNTTSGYAITAQASSGITIDGEGAVGSNASGVRGVGVGTGYGVAGYNLSGGDGVLGVSSTTGDGVHGSSTGSQSGVYGENLGSGGEGLAGRVVYSGTGFAVYGDAGNSGTAWAGFFVGRVFAQSYSSPSDARLKKDIRDDRYGLAEIEKLRPVSYKWKAEDTDQTTQLGLIAQEVSKVIPETVSADSKSGMLSVNYTELIPVLIKAVQEQQKTIEQQTARIASLEKPQRAVAASLLPTGALASLGLLGLFPIGLVAARRRNKRPQD